MIMFATEDSSYLLLPLVGLLTAVYLYSTESRKKKFPPRPVGVPLLGYAPFLGKSSTETFMKLSKKYGPIFSIKMGDNNWVVLNNYEVIHEALVKRGDAFSGRPHVHMYHTFNKGKGVGLSEGPFWKEQRKYGLQILKKFGFGSTGMYTLVQNEVEHLLNELSNLSDTAIDCHSLILSALSNIISEITFGRRFEYDDTEFTESLRKVNDGFGNKLDGKLFHIMLIASFTRFLPIFWTAYNRFAHFRRRFVGHVQAAVDEHKKTFKLDKSRDFIDEYLKEIKAREGTKSNFDEEQLVMFVVDLFIAGTETTSTSLRWFLLALISFPEMQEKMFQEIQEVVGCNRPLTFDDRDNLPYTNSVIHELMRHRMILPIFIPHKTLKAVDFRGYHLPKGTLVMPHMWSGHYDPKYFDNPEEFRPDRFLNDAGEFVSSQYVTPFSFGPRYCLGDKLARVELFLVVTGIVQKFQVVSDPKNKPPSFYDGVFGGVHAPHDFKCIFKKR